MGLLRRLSYVMLLTVFVGCGGGSLGTDTDTGGGGSDEAKTISLAISTTDVTGQNPGIISATVKQGNAVVSGEVVTFSTSIGALSPSDGTALTDSSGVATMVVTAGSVRGAGTVTASLASGEESAISFATQGDDIGVVGDISISLQLVDLSGNTTDTITSSKPGKVIATVNGITSPVIVTFATDKGEIPVPTIVTDDNNQAQVDILAGADVGAGTITASIVSGEFGTKLVTIGASNVFMGSGTPFVEDVADISLSTISAGGTTVVSVTIIDDQGNLYTEPVDVNFSSRCTSLATPSATLSSPVTTSNGTATSTYLAKGCVGDDTISATANAGGINLSATGVVNVLPADVGSIEFVSATPENITILGTGSVGGSESSTVVFRVLDTNSNPVNNQVVNFALNTNVGGIELIPDSATTDNNGLVQTVINSGTVATSVRVRATIDGSDPQISSQSSLLVVSTGIPDQDSFSLSANILNPEGWSVDGKEVEVTARLADAFNNPVPDGTAVSFTTEGGRIEDSCVTVKGSCTVIWNSQNTRPEGRQLTHQGCSFGADNNDTIECAEVWNTLGQKYGGRATILATVIGEESFADLNGNGRFDASETTVFAGTDISGQPYDLKEAFVDHNEDGFYNPDPTENEMAPVDPNDADSGILEEFADFNVDGSFTQNDGKYNGVLCSIPAHDGCSDQKSLNVRGNLVLIMSGSNAFYTINSTSDAVSEYWDHDNDPLTEEVNDPINPNLDSTDNTVYIAGENVGSASVVIADLHNQPMPAGTIITFTSTVGSVQGSSTFVWPNDNHNGGSLFGVSIKGEKEPKSGNLIIEATSPDGVITAFSAISIVIQ
ncbi:hypothetical protein AAD001_04320 [Colwelliaceae bacterium 6471]